MIPFREMIALLIREITFRLSRCTCTPSINVTDGQTTYHSNTALRTCVLHAVKKADVGLI